MTAVGGQPIAAAADRLTATFGYQADGFRRERLGERLTSVVFLRGVGLAPSDGPVRLRSSIAPASRGRWRSRWRPCPGGVVAADAPLARQHPDRYYWSRYLPEADAGT
ncbi:MAG: hypothetical protein IPH80_41435 [Myxococcales bacterium]|nr:hypothetical protein [Myxococcales bacterium]